MKPIQRPNAATAIHTVNRSALSEFQQAIETVNGEASLQVVGRAGPFDERVFERVLEVSLRAGIAAAGPVVAQDVVVRSAREGPATSRERLTILGLDVFRAARATPSLLPQPDSRSGDAGGTGSM